MGNRTVAAEDQISSQNVHNAQQNVVPYNNPEQPPQMELKLTPMSLKVKLIISAVIIVMLAGLGVGIYFIVDYYAPKVAVQKTSTFSFSDNSLITMHKVSLIDRNIKQDNQNLSLLITRTGTIGSGRRLQETEYSVFIKDHGAGLTVRMPSCKLSAIKKIQFLLVPQLFLSAIEKEDQSRMLQTDLISPDATLQAEYTQIEANLLSALSDLFSDVVEEYTDDIIKFKEQGYQKYRLVDGQFKLQPAPAQTRLLAKVKKGGRKKIKKTVAPAVQTVQDNGPSIGQVVGGVAKAAAGAITGGPAGIIGAIGSIAQNLLQACVPEDTDTFVCESAVGALESYPLLVGQAVPLETNIDTINRAINAN